MDHGVLAHPQASKPFSDARWVYALKFDGWRALATRSAEGVIRLRSRRGTDLTRTFPTLAAAIRELPGAGSLALDGEICALDEQGLPRFEWLRFGRRVAAPGRRIAFFAFDLLERGGKDLRRKPLVQRLKELRRLIPENGPHLAYVDHIPGEGELLYAYARELGLEGIVAKRADAPYPTGRTADWLKCKIPGYAHGWRRLQPAPPGRLRAVAARLARGMKRGAR